MGEKKKKRKTKALLKSINEFLCLVIIFVALILVPYVFEKFKGFDIKIMPDGIIWIEVGEEGKNEQNDRYLIGSEIILDNVYLYAAADEKQRTENKVLGKFYIYDGKIVNGFLRVCQSEVNVGKKPIENHVTG